jgi:hypothetical protein
MGAGVIDDTAMWKNVTIAIVFVVVVGYYSNTILTLF